MKVYSLDTVTDAPPEVCKQAELTRVRRGYWRNKWATNRGEILADSRWPSREVAEQKAIEVRRNNPIKCFIFAVRYLGPVFFPEGEDT